jgi:RNA polymerase sigma-70 factor (ECF subfamily)
MADRPILVQQPRHPGHLFCVEALALTSRNELSRDSVARAADGDSAAFTELVAAYNHDLMRVSYVILGDRFLAEDAVQTAWTKAWQRLHSLRDPAKVRSWLVAIAANEARQIARRIPRAVTSTWDGYGSDADPEHIDLRHALSRLSVDDRRLVGLRYALELTSAEIGEVLGLSAGGVRSRLMRLIARLRTELDRD